MPAPPSKITPRQRLVLEMSRELIIEMVKGRGKVEADFPSVAVGVVTDLLNRTIGNGDVNE